MKNFNPGTFSGKNHLTAIFRAVILLFIFSAFKANAQVTLTDNGSTVTVSNGIVSAEIEKGGAKVKILTYKGSSNLLGPKGDYYTTHVVYGTKDQWLGLGGSFSIVTNTSDMVDLAFHNPKMGADATYPQGLFDVTHHFVMRRGDAGYYNYTVWQHTNSQPEASFYQQRTTVSGSGNFFNSSASHMAYSFSGIEKFGQSIGGDLLTDEIINAVYKLPKTSYYTEPTGYTQDHYPVWTKYDWAVYSGDSTNHHNTWGASDDQYGIWRLCPSEEFLNGGPTKLRGGVQAGEVDLNTNEGHGVAGVDNLVGDKAVWEKIYGPFFVYVNKGSDHTALWNDAQAKGLEHVAAWPYSWVNESETLYPRSRGTVKGTITAHGQPGANAMVILGNDVNAAGQTGIDWPSQGGTNYLFWMKADANGNFSIPKVRPGTYTLYSYIPGVFEEMKVQNVVVNGGKVTNLGTLDWAPDSRQTLWRVGTPDHSAGEFKFGQLMRQFGLWWRYYEDQGQNDLTYVVGQSSPSQDWYYAQPVLPVNGTDYAPSWSVQFELAEIPPAPAVVRLALSGSMSTAFYIDVNGTNVDGGYRGIYTLDDRGLYRDNIKVAWSQYYEAQFDPKLLKVGTNTLTIRLRKPGGPSTNTVWPSAGIQYDCLALEVGPYTTGAIQGEDFCSAQGITQSKHTGFMGDGYLNLDKTMGSSASWNIYAQSATSATIGVRYANGGTTARGMNISVNGTQQATLTANPTGDWSSWSTEFITLNLAKGPNIVQFTATTLDGGPDIDMLAFIDSTLSAGGCSNDCSGSLGGKAYIDSCGTCVGGNTGKTACIQDCYGDWGGKATTDNCGACIGGNSPNQPCSDSLQAETACTVDGILSESKNVGFSGTGYVNTNNVLGASVSWVLNSTSNQTTTLTFRYANGGTTSRDGQVYINGTAVTTVSMPPTGAWTTWELASVNVALISGANNLMVSATTADGLANLDLIYYSAGVSQGQCVVTGITNTTNTASQTVYPSPTKGEIKWTGQQNWILINALGRELESGTGTYTDLSEYPGGVYFIKLGETIYPVIKQ